jgi:hypothetical protein
MTQYDCAEHCIFDMNNILVAEYVQETSFHNNDSSSGCSGLEKIEASYTECPIYLDHLK